jgi:predicted membrane-bound spermidine synthase
MTLLSRRRDLALAATFFTLSGAGALVYQIAWQRLLALSTGVAVHSVAIITAAFMAGLGIGSHLGGTLSARLDPRRSLVAFALVELAIAAFAVASVPLYYGVLYREGGFLYASLAGATLTHFVSLLPPTALMGMSLPLLVRGLVHDRAGAPRTIGVLYGANALGAALGAVLTPWLLMRFLGIRGAILVGAAGSAAAALGALLLARRAEQATSAEHPPQPQPGPAPARAADASGEEAAQPFSRWVALYAFSGFVSLSLEIVWFRVLDVTAKASAFTFGSLLSVYLFGLAAGTLVAARRAATIARPLRVFLWCQGGIVFATAAAHALLVWLPADWPGLAWLVSYGKTAYGVQLRPFAATEAFGPLAFLAVYVLLPLLLFGPSTFLMGFGFPVLQRATQADPATSGRRVGVLQAANIAGCVLGSLVTGLLLIGSIGASGMFRLLSAAAVLVALLGLAATRDRRFAALAAGLLVLAIAFPRRETLWLRLHGNPPAAESFVEEDDAGVTVLAPRPDGFSMAINGRYNSWLPYGWLHTYVGALPALVHQAPLEIAVLGLGSGDTAWAAGLRQETRSLTVFELASSTPLLLARVKDHPGMERVHNFLADPRVAFVYDDGRRRLRADGRKYDVIVADAIDYDTSMSNNIYSIEYYRLVKECLKPGGLVCVVAKTPRIRAALARVMTHTVSFGREDLILAGPEPIHIDREAWIARLRGAAVVDYLGRGRVREIVGLVRQAAHGHAAPPNADVNLDLEPKDEFIRPLRAGH